MNLKHVIMLEEQNDNLQENAEGNLKESTTTAPTEQALAENTDVNETKTEEIEVVNDAKEATTKDDDNHAGELEESKEATTIDDNVGAGEIEESKTEEVKTANEAKEATTEDDNNHVDEIEESNAEDAEDKDNEERHTIPVLDYHSMTMEALVVQLEKLVKNEKVQAIKKHVDEIKNEFDLKFQEFLDQKKEDFVNNGGNEIDFSYTSTTKNNFKKIYADYRDKRNQYYKELEQNLNQNLKERKDIIEELKGLLNVEESINSTYKHFKELQEKWRNAGAIPRNDYNNVWKTYHHHVERFYDFLHLNRDLRDLDFKHNLEDKLKIIEKAEALDKEEDLAKAFRELQTLHKIWKEDLGPVGKEHRDEIWTRFSNATKVLHQKRQDYYKKMDEVYEINLVRKNEIITGIKEINTRPATSHNLWQNQIREIEALRSEFFSAGKVPQKANENTWASFKNAVRDFNRGKNAFYKNLKKDQHDNLEKKLDLIKLAESLKESTDWNDTTPKMKKIQGDWKKIGHVPRKNSDKIWLEFKTACNYYFDKFHEQRNEANKEELEAFESKKTVLDALKEFNLSGDRSEDLKTIREKIAEWKTLGRVPFNKKNIDGKFHKIIDGLFKKLDIDKQEIELIKYGDKLKDLANSNDEYLINKERAFIKRKMDEAKAEIRQLENNLQFFSSASDDNPLVQDVVKKIDKQKKSLEVWQSKLKSLNIMKNQAIAEAKTAEDNEESAEIAES